MVYVTSLYKPNDFARENVAKELELLPGESRGDWHYHTLTKGFIKSKAYGKVNNIRANLLVDTGVKISVLVSAFARKLCI